MVQRILDVYFHGLLAGKLSQDNTGSLSFQYIEKYISNQKAPTLSVSMPIQQEAYAGDIPKAFFSGLLPDDIVRHRLARYLGLSEKNSFALLEAIGGECAGALSMYHEGEKPPEAKTNDMEKLDDKQLGEILDLLKSRPLMAGTDEIRLSLAGAQDKIAVGIIDGEIALVKGSTPTSHILKPVLDHVKDSVHNEFFCMRLAQLLKINVPKTEMRWLGDIAYFLIERYDRIRDERGIIKRLHQEDFCQALGIMPEMKYEREGGPSIAQCFGLLQQHSLHPAGDQLAFLQRVIFNYLIGNSDAHGKNYSLLYAENIPSLSPAYDLLCTTVYPALSRKMAMKIGKEYDPEHIFLRHWHQIVPDTIAARKNLEKELKNMSKNCVEKAQDLKHILATEGIKSPIFNDICNIIKKRAEHIGV